MANGAKEHVGAKPQVENDEKLRMSGSDELSRQITMQLSPDQYERLFFQPTKAKGDLATRFGKTRAYQF